MERRWRVSFKVSSGRNGAPEETDSPKDKIIGQITVNRPSRKAQTVPFRSGIFPDFQTVGQGNHDHFRQKLMISVRTFALYAQKQVNLGWRFQKQAIHLAAAFTLAEECSADDRFSNSQFQKPEASEGTWKTG